jgi:glucose/mannose-6-phosphate isomerase
MMGHALNFPAQVKQGAQVGKAFEPPKSFWNPKLIVLSGMGGSAIAGDMISRLCEKKAPVPFLVNRDYSIPNYISKDTLFIASSHSGNTEETLEAVKHALKAGARVLAISTGGALRDFANAQKRARVAWLQIPQTDPPMPPRAALGYPLFMLLRVLETIGVYPGAGREIGESVKLLSELRDRLAPEVPASRNQAKQLALKLQGRFPWVHGTAGIMGIAALRWRTQLNENSKMLACSAEYPELNHNETIGWEGADWAKDQITVIALRSPSDHWRIRARIDITKKKFLSAKAPIELIEAKGKSPLAQLISTVYLGDMTSIYLAFLNGVDPGSIDSIDILKSDLAKLKAR